MYAIIYNLSRICQIVRISTHNNPRDVRLSTWLNRWLRLSLLLPPSGHFLIKNIPIRCINARLCLQNHDPTDFGVHPFFQRIHPLSQEMSLAHCELVARSFQKRHFRKKIENPEKSIIQVFDLKIRKKNLLLFKNIFFIPFPHLPKNVILSFYIK